MGLLCLLGNLYFFVILGRVLMSWFPPPREGAMVTVTNTLHSLTEPVLAPVRRVVPPLGMFDLSVMVVIFGLQILLGALGCGVGL